MRDDEFQDLALKALAADATPEDRTTLEAAFAADPARRVEFEDMRAAFAITQATLPLADALEARGNELPRYRMGQLRSAVHSHFRERDAAESEEGGVVSWVQTLWGQVIYGSGLIAICVLVVLVSLPGPKDIEVGYYAEQAARGEYPVFNVAEASHQHVNLFENDKTFDQWLAQPFGKNEKARVWIDEEHDQIHVRLHPVLFMGSREFTRPLPEFPVARRAALNAVIAELKK